eukprot:RCo052722
MCLCFTHRQPHFPVLSTQFSDGGAEKKETKRWQRCQRKAAEERDGPFTALFVRIFCVVAGAKLWLSFFSLFVLVSPRLRSGWLPPRALFACKEAALDMAGEGFLGVIAIFWV